MPETGVLYIILLYPRVNIIILMVVKRGVFLQSQTVLSFWDKFQKTILWDDTLKKKAEQASSPDGVKKKKNIKTSKC